MPERAISTKVLPIQSPLPRAPAAKVTPLAAGNEGDVRKRAGGRFFQLNESAMLKLYHAEPLANSLKSLIPFKEKGLEFQSVYVDLHKFEQHEPWFVAINPEGQVPVLDHDGVIITHTTVINEYLEDAFPDLPPLRP